MKLHAKMIPYSSIVGGGVLLCDEDGRARFNLSLLGTTEGVTRSQNDQILEQVTNLINKDGLIV